LAVQEFERHPGSPREGEQKCTQTQTINPTIFFEIKGIVHNEFVMVDQTVSSTYCCDVACKGQERNTYRLLVGKTEGKRSGHSIDPTFQIQPGQRLSRLKSSVVSFGPSSKTWG
jgi:hypothetical protein